MWCSKTAYKDKWLCFAVNLSIFIKKADVDSDYLSFLFTINNYVWVKDVFDKSKVNFSRIWNVQKTNEGNTVKLRKCVK